MTNNEPSMTRRYLDRMMHRPRDPQLVALEEENAALKARVATLEAEAKVHKRMLADG